jgi:putative ABC transport system permease protein
LHYWKIHFKQNFFPTENPLGKTIKCGANWLTVIGVLEERIISESSIAKLGIRDLIWTCTPLSRQCSSGYENRDLVTKSMLDKSGTISRGRYVVVSAEGEDEEPSAPVNYHQLDKLVVQVAETEMLNPIAEIISRLLERRHFQVIDFQITIPELLLKQQQRTNQIFNFVLGAIAGISLLVGGIGIMNIMLASVLERIKEIGLRLSLGAKKKDIVTQFVFEAVMISISGGLIGIILGIVLALLVSRFAEIPTIVTFTSVLLSFGVAATVGLIFGITPARRAASQDPITSLRYE